MPVHEVYGLFFARTNWDSQASKTIEGRGQRIILRVSAESIDDSTLAPTLGDHGVTQPVPQTLFVVLSEDNFTGRIAVELDAYARFRIQMERDFAELEAKFAHLAPRPLEKNLLARGVKPLKRRPK